MQIPNVLAPLPPAARAAALLALLAPAAALADVEPLDLVDAYRLAGENDPAFQAAGARRDAAAEAVGAARAELMPSVSLNGSGDARFQDLKGRDPDSSGPLSVSLDLTHPLYRRDLHIRLDRAQTGEEKAELDYAASRQALILRVSTGYFGVLNALDKFRLAQTNREAIAQQLRQAQQRFEVGLIAITDVEEAKARFDLASAGELEAKNALDNARELLREVTGEYPEELAPLGEEIPLAMPDPPDIDQWTRTALERNLALQSAKFNVTIADEDIRLAQAGGTPVLNLVGRVGANRVVSNDTFQPESTSASVGVQLRMNLFTGGRVTAATAEARARHRQRLHERERARREAVRTTREAYLGVESGIAQVQALAQAVVSSQSALDAVEAGFEVGTRTSVDVLDAQRDLFEARNRLTESRYAYILNALRLREASGTLDAADLETINDWLE